MRWLVVAVAVAVGSWTASAHGQSGVRTAQSADQKRDNARAERLNQQARAAMDAGRYDEAFRLAERSRQAFERLFGANDIGVASALLVIGRVHKLRGDLPRAEQALLRGLSILERALGGEHEALVPALNALSTLYHARADSRLAIHYAERALAIVERIGGADHPNVATLLNNMAQAHKQRGQEAKAEQLLRRALAIRVKAHGPNHPLVAVSLRNLAVVEYEHGRYAKATGMLERALAIEESALGPQHPGLLATLNNLALQVAQQGDHQRAERLYRRAIAICEASAPDHPQLSRLHENLGALMWRTGRHDRALQAQLTANEARERYVAKVLTAGSEAQRFLFLSSAAIRGDGSLSLHAQAMPGDPRALRMALTQVLRRKGRLLDISFDTLRALRRSLGPQEQKQLAELSELRAGLARDAMAGRPAAEQAVRIRRAEQLEAALAAHSAAFRAHRAPVTIEAVQRAIPAGAALIELARYQPFDPSARQQTAGRRYAGYVLRRKGEPSWADLGEARPIDDLVTALRQALANPGGDPRAAGRALDERVMVPLRKLSGDARHLLIAADGKLNLVPFGALVDDQGRFVVQTHTLSYLTTGRDLLRMDAPAAPRSAPLIVASPDFGSAPSLGASSGSRAVDWRKVVFTPLPGTAEEGARIAKLVDGAALLRGVEAREDAIKQVHGPKLLHVATHGFFLGRSRSARPPASRGLELVEAQPAAAASASVMHPLMRSGLALAGANVRAGKEDGVLTAYEAASLDLWGTKLVVLSACETGVGGSHDGEGVYGLRRALAIAGAETLVMSLWKVDDEATGDLMAGYYQGLQRGGGRSGTLREAQLAMLRTEQYAHPYYWSSFIAIGDWRTLEGREPAGAASAAEQLEVQPARGCGCRLPAPRSGSDPAWPWILAAVAARRRFKGLPRRWRRRL